MILPGRLSATTLGDVLGALHRARVSGRLELIGRDDWQAGQQYEIVLRDGLIVAVRGEAAPKLGELLVQQRALSTEAHERFERVLACTPWQRAGELLLRMHLVDDTHLQAALRAQMLARLEAAYRLRQAELRFRPDASKPEQGPVLGPPEFLHGRPRKREAASAQQAVKPASKMREQALRLLGLEPSATKQQIRAAFRQLARQSHPDLAPHASTRERATRESHFARLSAAYHWLLTDAA